MKRLLGLTFLSVFSVAAAGKRDLLRVEILSPDGKPLANATWTASEEFHRLDIPNATCGADTSKPLSLSIQATQPTPQSISVSCSDECRPYVVEPRWRTVAPGASLLHECTNGMLIKVRRANNSSKPTPLRGAA
ncbi:hypothetical protein PAGU2595_028550 [Lysobacter xanthus]